MGLFSSNKSSAYLGIDIGASGIKMVELANERGKARLLTYGYTTDVPSADGSSLFDDPKRAGKVLAKLLKESEATSRRAVASLPLHAVYTSVIAIPEPKNQAEAMPIIEAQAAKLLPMPIEEMMISSTFIDDVKKESVLKKEVGKKGDDKKKKGAPVNPQDLIKSKPKQKNVRVLITAAPRSLVGKYVELFKTAGVDLVALDTEPFGLVRSLVGEEKSTVLLVDVGARRTNLTVVERGVPFFTRSVEVGGFSITKALSDTLKVSIEEAEQMKFDMGVGAQSDLMPVVIEKVFGQLINEVRYVFEQYARQEFSDGKRVEKVVITGGSAHIPGFDQFFVKNLNLNAYIGDPWARVMVPEDLRGLLDTIGPSLSISVGLAMRDL